MQSKYEMKERKKKEGRKEGRRKIEKGERTKEEEHAHNPQC